MFFRTNALFLLRAANSSETRCARAQHRRGDGETRRDRPRVTRASPTPRDDSSDQERAGKADDRGTRILGRTPYDHFGGAKLGDDEVPVGKRGRGGGRNDGDLPRRILGRRVDLDRTDV